MGKWIRNMATEFTIGPTAVYTKVIGLMESSTVRANISYKLAKLKSESGSTAKGLNGYTKTIMDKQWAKAFNQLISLLNNHNTNEQTTHLIFIGKIDSLLTK